MHTIKGTVQRGPALHILEGGGGGGNKIIISFKPIWVWNGMGFGLCTFNLHCRAGSLIGWIR